jgi:hypothetical protein
MPREGGASSTPRRFGSITGVSGILDHPPSRVMTTEIDFQTAKPSSRANGSRERAPDDRLREAIHVAAREAWIASSLSLLAMTWIQFRDLAARSARVLLENSLPSQSEGAGNAGRSMRPQPGGQKRVEVLTSSGHHGHTGITRHSPRNGLRLISCSPRRPGFVATVARAP